MADDLGLHALARIQMLEALPMANEFRRRWLDGVQLPDEFSAEEWLRGQIWLGLTRPMQSGIVGEMSDFTVYVAAAEFDSRGRIRTRRMAWKAHAVVGQAIRPIVHEASEGTALFDLARLVGDLADDFGREWLADGPMYVLCGIVPRLEAVSIDGLYIGRRLSAGPVLSSPLRSIEVTLRCRTQATAAEVTAAYQRAQRDTLGSAGFGLRERTRPVTSWRTHNLAVFGALIADNHYPTWHAAMMGYREMQPADGTYTGARDHGRFRRDVRRAYQAVTGFDLLWTPKRDGSVPVISAPAVEGERVGVYRSKPGQSASEYGIEWETLSEDLRERPTGDDDA